MLAQDLAPMAPLLKMHGHEVSSLGAPGSPGVAFAPATDTGSSYLLDALNKKQTLVCGHRGAAGYAPENTMPSFQLALTEKCQMFECDIRRSADNQIIVIHDDDLSRTTSGHGRCRSHRYTGDIDKLDAGSWFSSAYAGARVPTLNQLLQWCKDKPILPLIHLKETGLASDVAKILQDQGMADKVAVHSEILSELDAFEVLSPKTVTIPIWFDHPAPPDDADLVNYLKTHHHAGVALPYDLKDPGRIPTLEAKGYFVELFTLKKYQPDITNAVNDQPTFITGDYPDLILNALGA